MYSLYHISSHPALKHPAVGMQFTLSAGRHNAEGIGVYFSEGKCVPLSTAEGAYSNGMTGIVHIRKDSVSDWWRSKNNKSKKFGKPRTWHSNNKSLVLEVNDIKDNIFYCNVVEEINIKI